MIKYFINYNYSKSNKCNLPDILPPVKRIIAIGDTHGDIIVSLKSLKLANVIDFDDNKLKNISTNDNFNWIKWTGNDTVVVQVGDQIDSCRMANNVSENNCIDQLLPDLLVFKLFDKINQLAKSHNGAVYSLLGNHEIMNVMGDFRYVSKSSISIFDPNDFDNAKLLRKKYFSKGNSIANYLACTRKTSIVIGNNLFVHGGIVPEIAKQYNITDINSIISKWLSNNIDDPNDLLTHEYKSPFWNRLFGNLPPNVDINNHLCNQLTNTMELYNVGNMIVGHTPQFIQNKSGINNTCNGSIDNKQYNLWRIDVGASKAFDMFQSNKHTRDIQILEIINDNQFNIIK